MTLYMTHNRHNEIVGKSRTTARPLRSFLFLLAMVCYTTTALAGVVIRGSVFGGGNAASVGNTEVNITASTATVQASVYGGCNTQGAVTGNATVNITGGTVGTVYGGSGPIADRVFGGGYGQPTLINGNVTVSIGTDGQLTDGATIHGNVYGGGALGSTNASKSGDVWTFYTDGVTAKSTNVYLYKGTINGNVFGGGLGQKEVEAADAVGSPGDPGYKPAVAHEDAIEAYVGGSVNVLLDGAKVTATYTGEGENRMPSTGQIFGANNMNGTPKGHVKVHVKRTVDSGKDTEVARDSRTTYDLAAVYGGGNQADYIPTDATLNPAVEGNPAKIAAASAEVLIEGCDLTSIEYIYGGGNAAAVPATDVTILGTYIADYVFGGGNGKSTASFTNPGANIGSYNNGATNYGSGKAVTKIVGGHIHYVFGGSNTLGNVRGGTFMTMPEIAPTYSTGYSCCTVRDIRDLYGAGKSARQDGPVNLILGCVTGMNTVYGGARDADIAGGINLTITSGSFAAVYGGNDHTGTIQGPITLNIEETACDPITITNLYLGGNEAPYSIYGYKDVAGTLVARTKAEFDALTAEQKASEGLPYRDPILNVISCTSIGNVYGGGKGSTAIMYGSPTVNLNMIPGKYASSIDRDGDSTPDGNTHALGTIGNVYGGGDAAAVYGTDIINIGTAETVTMTSVEDDPATDGVNEHTPSVEGTRIIGNVYGGGNEASVFGGTQVNIGTLSYTTTGYEGVRITGDVFGGGKGETTKVTDDVAVTIGTRTPGSPDTYTGNASIIGNIYGGSALGSVNADGSPLVLTEGATTAVTLNIGTITGSIYGGGLGQRNGVNEATSDIISDVYGPVTVTVYNGTVSGAVYGCNNLNGSPKSTVAVNINGTAAAVPQDYSIPTVYGGGNLAPYTGTGGLSVNMSAGYVNDVFGGGLGSSATVTGNTAVAISGGSVIHNVYGGGSEAQVTGGTSVTLSGTAAIGNDVYGGGSEANVTNTVTVALNGGTVGRDVYGGGALAETNTVAVSPGVYPATSVTLAGATVTGSVYGGGLGRLAAAGTPAVEAVAANVHGPVTVTVSDGSAANVFGCNNLNGSPQGTVAVTISGTTAAVVPAYSINNVYGGGNQAAYNGTGGLSVSMSGGTVNNVYGGGLGAPAVVTGNTSVSISGGSVVTNVYGGGSEAQVNGSTTVSLSDGTIGNDVYGGGKQADVTQNVSVSVSDNAIVTHDVYGGGALANTNTDNWNANDFEEVSGLTPGTSVVTGLYSAANDANLIETPNQKATEGAKYYQKGTWFSDKIDGEGKTTYKTTVSLTGGIIGNAYGGGLGRLASAGPPAVSAVAAIVYGDVTITVDGVASRANYGRNISYTDEHSNTQTAWVPYTGRIFGANNINGTPKGNIKISVESTRYTANGTTVSNDHVLDRWELHSIYGGGNQANYLPADGRNTEVEINGCGETSICYVYGGGNSASVPQTKVTINSCFQIGSVFGGGNGNDPIETSPDNWVYNPGADVIRIGGVPGTGSIRAKGGTIGWIYGGSNKKGDCGHIEEDISQDGDCPLKVTNVYGAGKNANVASVNIVIKCPGDNVDYVYGGSLDANITGDVKMTIIGGQIKNVFGGNNDGGSIGGDIEVNVQETHTCQPVIIDNLYGGGNLATYPGNNMTGGNITVNIKSATRIGNIFGGGKGNSEGDRGIVNGNTTVNINMKRGNWAGSVSPITLYREEADFTGKTDVQVKAALEKEIPNIVVTSINRTNYTATCTIKSQIGTIGNVFGGGDAATINGNTTVNIGTKTTVPIMRHDANGVPVNSSDQPIYDAETGEPFGDGRSTVIAYDNPDVLGVNITGNVYGGGNQADVTGNTDVNICANPDDSYASVNLSGEGKEGVKIGGSVYGGGNLGSVGTFNFTDGKPSSLKTENTGKCTVRILGYAEIGQDDMKMTADEKPDNSGNVFGASMGGSVTNDVVTVSEIESRAYVDMTYVTIGNNAFVKASVYGGSENGRVLHDTHVTIQDNCQIGNGWNPNLNAGAGGGVNARYDEALFIDPTDPETTASQIETAAASTYECAHWPYESPYAPFDKFSGTSGGATGGTGHFATDGHTFYGNVFGGGSGLYPYTYSGGTKRWLSSAGKVFGNTNVTITGGHILTSVYGGCEMTDVDGTCTIIMSGGTLGVPRTLTQIAAHPVTCYLFGGGKGDARPFFKDMTNVGNVSVTVSGGKIYGSVFGGGEDGHVTGNVTVNIQDGAKIGTWGTSYVDGNIFGGGRGFTGEALLAGNVAGKITMTISGGKMLGSIYGGGRLGSVGYNTAAETDAGTTMLTSSDDQGAIDITISGGTIGNNYEYKYYATDASPDLAADHIPNTSFDAENRLVHTKGGNVYAGSMGRREMLGSSDPITDVDWLKLGNAKSTKLTITGGTIKSNVYGGGEFGAVLGKHTTDGKDLGTEINISGNTTVIGTKVVDGSDPTKFYYFGSVFGGGMGHVTYGGGDTKMNTFVSMSNGKVTNSIYGGGEMANVGTYKAAGDVDYDVTKRPATCPSGGTTYVSVSGGEVGPNDMVMPMNYGHVFGGGKGEIGNTATAAYANLDNMAFVNTTNVTISSTAFVKGSVYGGSQNGHVLGNTNVTISGGQIGNGWNPSANAGAGGGVNARYDEALFIDPTTATAAQIETAAASTYECASWPYGDPYDSYDKYAGSYDSKGGSVTPHDGHTFYGNVFGGGSGYWPYAAGGWVAEAGAVYGNTNVTISGGHILTSVYGGNEMTNVSGTCNVTMSGGTLGVPRTLTQINAHPVTCYIFGGGKGDQRVLFNRVTNATDAVVTVNGGKIYGSVFGGGEDGHIMRDATVNIGEGAKIGTWGTSYVDGNVFGGGRGFAGDAYTAGNVAGKVTVNVTGGQMLGSIYGGGRLGSVGYGLYDVGNANYGVMRDDDKKDDGTDGSTFFTHGRGHIEVNVSGGIIGSIYEYKFMTSSIVPTDYATPQALAAARKAELLNTHHVVTPDITYDTDLGCYRVSHALSGNVYGGGMGRRELLDGETKNTIVDWWKLGNAKSTKVNISGSDTWIKGSVYGGSEYGAVTGSHTTDGKTYGTEVIINGATIGSIIGNVASINPAATKDDVGSGDTRYAYGHVYGGGYGTGIDADAKTTNADVHIFGGLVSNNTRVNLQNTVLRSTVFGGGKVACVGGDTYVNISNSQIGVSQLKTDGKTTLFGGWRMGNVYGGGSGSDQSTMAGVVMGNTYIDISGTTTVAHNVYGGGSLASVGTFTINTDDGDAIPDGTPTAWTNGGTATVTITGTAQIGINGRDNGMVFGSSRGNIEVANRPAEGEADLYDKLGWVNNTVVTIGKADHSDAPVVKGSVFGGGENGHNFGNAQVTVHSGIIGNTSATDWDCGNVYGAGCGTDTYSAGGTNPKAGHVNGSTTVTVDGGTVVRTVYGGGSMGAVGGSATVNIEGGTIGDGTYNNGHMTLNYGDVYGGGAMANSNTNNWNPDAANYVPAVGMIAGLSSIYGYYTESGGVYTKVTDLSAKAAAGTTYYIKGNWAAGKTSASNITTVNLKGGKINGMVFGGGLGSKPSLNDMSAADIPVNVYGNVLVNLNQGASDNCKVLNVYGGNNYNGSPKGDVTVHVYKTVAFDATYTRAPHKHDTGEGDGPYDEDDTVDKAYDVMAVYGGGNEAPYIPQNPDGKKSTVIIDGCELTSIKHVYGGSNAAPVPASQVTINGTYEIFRVFGGGNGLTELDDGRDNPGANVGFMKPSYGPLVNPATAADWVSKEEAAFTAHKGDLHFGDGTSEVFLYGGTIHQAFGGSNQKGNVRTSATVDIDEAGECPLHVDEVYGAGNAAESDGTTTVNIGCISYLKDLYGGARKAIINNDIQLNIQSGRFERVFGGNNIEGQINGTITVNIEETGCHPIIIGQLYGAGNLASYEAPWVDPSDHSKGRKNGPTINVKSFTSIGDIYGGGYGASATVTGDVHVNINECDGRNKAADIKTPSDSSEYTGETWTLNEGTLDEVNVFMPLHRKDSIGVIGNVFGGGNAADVNGNAYVSICTEPTIDYVTKFIGEGAVRTGVTVVGSRIHGSVFGGGNNADVTKNTYVTISGDAKVATSREDISGSVYGGGNKGSVGTYNTRAAAVSPATLGKPTACDPGTGICTVVINGNAEVGPNDMLMTRPGGPDDMGHVFGGCKGENADTTVAANANIPYKTYVDSTSVTIGGNAWVKGSVYGGGENGHVLHNSGVLIEDDCQIGNGMVQAQDNGTPLGAPLCVNRRYTAAEWAAGHLIINNETDRDELKTLVANGGNTLYTASLPECASWPYGTPWLPYDRHAEVGSLDARPTGSNGSTFYGMVFGGGSGYWPYAKSGDYPNNRVWIRTNGRVEGNSSLTITGGHILTNAYGGAELCDVLGKSTVTMTGGTVGVPRTLGQTTSHPVTCYVFGAGKGDTRKEFNTWTHVGYTDVRIRGGWVYGSVFGGGEDGHVLVNSHVAVSGNINDTYAATYGGTATQIGTMGYSYVDGNIFGGGRGFSGEALTAGVVSGNVSIDITGGHMLGSIYGGGRLASVGTQLVGESDPNYGNFIDGNDHGFITVNISGGTIGNNSEYVPIGGDRSALGGNTTFDASNNRLLHTKGGNVFTGCMGRLTKLDGSENTLWQRLGLCKGTTLNVTGGTIKSNVYGGGEFGSVQGNTLLNIGQALGKTTVIGTVIGEGVNQYNFGSVFGGGMGKTETPEASKVTGNTQVNVTGGMVRQHVFGGGEAAKVEGNTNVKIGN